jgi:glycosyltransferase involved in cell wall biosynthesis
MHCRLDQPDLAPVYRYYQDLPLVSISNAQRGPLPEMHWVATVYHGLPQDAFRFDPTPGKYLAFLGRLSPEKRPELAIEIARRAGIPLKIAAKVDEANQEYFETVIKPLLVAPGVEYLGEIGGVEKQKFLAEALALLFPIDWPEPFGLVMIEALACGTPVIARPCGSVPEIIRDGVSGFVREGIEELVQAAREIGDLQRRNCRDEFESRFTLEHMVAAYEQVYYELLAEPSWTPMSKMGAERHDSQNSALETYASGASSSISASIGK